MSPRRLVGEDLLDAAEELQQQRALLDLHAVEVGRDGARQAVEEVGVLRVLADV